MKFGLFLLSVVFYFQAGATAGDGVSTKPMVDAIVATLYEDGVMEVQFDAVLLETRKSSSEDQTPERKYLTPEEGEEVVLRVQGVGMPFSFSVPGRRKDIMFLGSEPLSEWVPFDSGHLLESVTESERVFFRFPTHQPSLYLTSEELAHVTFRMTLDVFVSDSEPSSYTTTVHLAPGEVSMKMLTPLR